MSVNIIDESLRSACDITIASPSAFDKVTSRMGCLFFDPSRFCLEYPGSSHLEHGVFVPAFIPEVDAGPVRNLELTTIRFPSSSFQLLGGGAQILDLVNGRLGV